MRFFRSENQVFKVETSDSECVVYNSYLSEKGIAFSMFPLRTFLPSMFNDVIREWAEKGYREVFGTEDEGQHFIQRESGNPVDLSKLKNQHSFWF